MNILLKQILAGAVSGMFLAGCATTDSPDVEAPDAEAPPTHQPTAPAPSGKVTMTVNRAPLGDLVRAAGAISGGGIVLMNGLELRMVEGLSFRQAPLAGVASQLAEAAGLQVETRDGYSFIYPEGYETLLSLDPAAQLDPSFAAPGAAVSFGSGTALYNVFAALGRSLGATVVADNAVADARCGELALREVPIGVTLRAILQSARIAPDGYALSSTDEFVFFASPANSIRNDCLLNGEALAPEQRARLDARVTLVLPEISDVPEHIALVTGAEKLADVLPALSEQMGLPVQIEAGLGDLPVNYTVMTNVRRSTAMNLLIWQWLRPDFGYELRGDGSVLIRVRS